MVKTVLAAIVAAVLSGCVNLNPNTMEIKTPAGPRPNQEAIETYVKAYLARSLKDPDSLKQYRFVSLQETRWMRGSMNGGGADAGWLACIEYNAKNSYGAYTGVKAHPFVFRASGDSVYEVQGATGQIMANHC